MKMYVVLAIILLFSITIQNCNSQNIDLAELSFTENVNTLLEGVNNKVNTGRFTPDGMVQLSTADLNSIVFQGVDLKGSQVLGRSERAPGSKETNRVSFMFYGDDPDSTLQVFSLQINTTQESKRLLEIMREKYDRPIYSDGKELNIETAESLDMAVFFWENSKTKTGVFLRQDATENENPHEIIITTSMYVFKNTPEIRKNYDPRLYN